MTFLAPLFLAGLLGVAIPIVVHLTHRPRREAYAFPSLMFLARIPFRSVKRQRVRHWWLLALRMAVGSGSMRWAYDRSPLITWEFTVEND